MAEIWTVTSAMSPSIQARSDDVGDVQDYLAKVKSTHESGECKTGGPQVMRRFPDRARHRDALGALAVSSGGGCVIGGVMTLEW